jgi:hypothetical protein
MHPRSLRKLRHEGAIPYVNTIGRKIAYRPEDCDAFIQERLRMEPPIDRDRAKGRGRTRPRPQQGGNVHSFMARRQARLEGRGG